MRRRDFLRALVAAPIAAAAPPIVAAFLAEQPRQIADYVWRPARDARIRGEHATLLIIDDPPAPISRDLMGETIRRVRDAYLKAIDAEMWHGAGSPEAVGAERKLRFTVDRWASSFSPFKEPPCDPS